MTIDEAKIKIEELACYARTKGWDDEYTEAVNMAIKALEQEPCEDAISRQAVLDINEHYHGQMPNHVNHEIWKEINALQSVTPQPKMGRCKDCKYFEYDSVAKVNGIPLIVAHEICKRWGDGCKSKEDGYCFLFEPKMQEVEE